MRRTPLHLRVLTVPALAVAALAITHSAAGAQSQSRDNLTGVWALTNARIETITKGTIDRGTIVIRNGVIEAVGASVNPPADAIVVDLSGKTIVPAFIDLTSSLGLPQPAAEGRGGAGRFRIPGGTLVVNILAGSAFLVTLGAIVLSMIPPDDGSSPVLFELKVVGGSTMLIAIGFVLYVARRR